MAQHIPTALMQLIIKYENPPAAGEYVAEGQLPSEACCAVVHNDLAELDKRIGGKVCNDFYLQVRSLYEISQFIDRRIVVRALRNNMAEIAAASERQQAAPADIRQLHAFLRDIELGRAS